jgi:CheY-like chemotaxis protein
VTDFAFAERVFPSAKNSSPLLAANQYQSAIDGASRSGASYVVCAAKKGSPRRTHSLTGKSIFPTNASSHTAVLALRARPHEEPMTVTRRLVTVVDDDESVRESLPDLVREFGFAVRAFSSPEEFLASDCVGQTSCLILDIAMPGMSGPDLQRELQLRGQEIPIIFITASTDKTVRQQLLEQGAVECLFKPFSDTALLDALHAALQGN